MQVFLIFFFTLVFMGSMIFNLIGPSDQEEYAKIGPFTGSIIFSLRLSLGDFDFSKLDPEFLSQHE